MKLILFSMLLSTASQAAPASDSIVYHADGAGARIETKQALVAAIAGEKVFRCQEIEAKLSKSGKSYGLVLKKVAKDAN